MTKAPFDIHPQVPAGVTRSIYAGVGVTDRVVEVVREYVATAQKRAQSRVGDVQKSVSGLDYQPQALREHATKVVTAQLETLTKDAQVGRKAFEERVATLQKILEEQAAGAGVTYDEMVKRGETVVGRIMGQKSTQQAVEAAETTVAKAKTTRTQATKTAKKSASNARKSPAKSSAKATSTSATKAAKSAVEATSDAAEKIGDSENAAE
jgi:heparin binding hemagglutinin HbhA